MSRILNIAHRGFTRDYPDNTLEAFEAAIQIPADGIECDVRETADNRFVMFHDPELSGEPIERMKLDEIGRVRLPGGFRVPTLEETLELCRGRVMLNVELKQVSLLEGFVRLARGALDPEEVALSSFNRDLIVALADAAPEIRRGVITAGAVEDPVGLAGETRSNLAIMMYPFTNSELVGRAHAGDLPVFVWGCRDMADVGGALATGLDGIITDWPDQTRDEIARLPGNQQGDERTLRPSP